MRELERTAPDTHAAAPVAVIGAGRLGSALARRLAQAGHPVHGPASRAAAAAAARHGDIVILAVPDTEIEPACLALAAAGVLRPGTFVGHTSGATALDALDPAERAGGQAFSLHPLMTVAGAEAELAGAGCAIAARTEAGLTVAEGLAADLGMTAFAIPEEARAAYHAAASLASNFLVTLQSAAERLAGAAGLEPAEARALLAPLVRQTVENWAARGPEGALTGPIARGDEATVAAHERALAEHAPELLDLYRKLADHTRELAAREVPA